MTLLLCDVDGVLADFLGAVLDVLHDRCGVDAKREDVTEWSIRNSLGLTDQQWRTVLDRLIQKYGGTCAP